MKSFFGMSSIALSLLVFQFPCLASFLVPRLEMPAVLAKTAGPKIISRTKYVTPS